MQRLSIEDFLLIAEAVLGAPAEGLARATRLGAAASALAAPFATQDGRERYPELGGKAAVLGSRLVRNHPLPDGNKRVALIAMLELVERNQGIWLPMDQMALATAVERLAGRDLSEEAFAAWIRAHVKA
jgi:death-on-curing protein